MQKTMTKRNYNVTFGFTTLMILIAAFSRLIPHPYNFAPIGAMALFGGAYYSNKYWAYFIPIISMWISDLFLNNVIYHAYFTHFTWLYSGSLFTYGAFMTITFIGTHLLKRITMLRIFFSSISSSILFFLISNFGVWFSQSMQIYPHNFNGLLNCYIAGLPFFKNTLLGDFFYTGVMFGISELFGKNICDTAKIVVHTEYEKK